MTMLMNRLIIFFCLLILNGCAPSAYVNATETSRKKISLCDVVENFESYDGAEIELSARYVSDGKHEEVLEDLTCSQGRRIIDIGRRGNSESVARFYAARKRICSERGAAYLCNTSAEVDVSGTINVMSGQFVLDIKEVKQFDFFD